MNGKKANVNLASQPLRNRRFFFTLLSLAAGLFLVVAGLSALSYSKSRAREGSVRGSLVEMRRMTETARKEKNDWSLQIRDLSRKYRDKIDSTNAIILKKSFSWVDFFSKLEEALPTASFITWFASIQAAEGNFEFKFKVVSQSLSDLLALIQRLDALGFKNISMRNEVSQPGQVVSEIALSHERAF